MALTDKVQSQLAFKKLFGKSLTSETKRLGNESYSSNVGVSGDFVYVDAINANPSQSLADGFVRQITAILKPDITSNGQAFVAYYTDTELSGSRAVNAIPPSYGYLYEAVPMTVDNKIISVDDSRDWVYQY